MSKACKSLKTRVLAKTDAYIHLAGLREQRRLLLLVNHERVAVPGAFALLVDVSPMRPISSRYEIAEQVIAYQLADQYDLRPMFSLTSALDAPAEYKSTSCIGMLGLGALDGVLYADAGFELTRSGVYA